MADTLSHHSALRTHHAGGIAVAAAGSELGHRATDDSAVGVAAQRRHHSGNILAKQGERDGQESKERAIHFWELK